MEITATASIIMAMQNQNKLNKRKEKPMFPMES